MTKLSILLAALALAATPAITHATKPSATPSKASPGKPRAPVAATAEISGETATVKITFEAAASKVSVKVYGTGGLEVVSAEPHVAGEAVAAGDTRTLSVKFTKGEGVANLAVHVSGDFAGPAKSRAFAFRVGTETPSQKAARSGTVHQTESGEKVKALPTEQK